MKIKLAITWSFVVEISSIFVMINKGSFTYYIITKGEGGFRMITLM